MAVVAIHVVFEVRAGIKIKKIKKERFQCNTIYIVTI